MSIHAVHAGEDIKQHFGRRLSRVNRRDYLFRIIRKHGLRFRLVGIEATLDDLFVRVVEAIVFQRALFQARKKGFTARAREVKHFFHVDHFLHDFRLADVPGNAVEDERVNVRFKLMRVHRRLDRLPPELDRNLIRHELTFARVFQEGFADFCARIDRAENIAAGAMIKARDRAERFPLGAFAAARGAEQNERVVSHQRNSLYRRLVEAGKQNQLFISQPRSDRY